MSENLSSKYILFCHDHKGFWPIVGSEYFSFQDALDDALKIIDTHTEIEPTEITFQGKIVYQRAKLR